MGVRRFVAFGRRHQWPVTAAATVASVAAIAGIVLAVSAWNNGSYLAGYFGGAACGDVLIWGVLVLVALWAPRTRVQVE